MRAVLMAGGSGTRLRPLTCDLPKPMVPLLNRPIAEHIIYLLKHHGIDEVIATLHYLPDILRDYFQDGSKFGVRMSYAVEEETPLGTAGCVKNVEELLGETFLVISGDSVTDFDLTQAIAFHHDRGAKATIVLKRVDNPLDFGVVITDETGRIQRFLEKPSTSEVFSDTVNTGIYILEPEVLRNIPKGQEADFSKDLFPMLLDQGTPLYGYIAEGYWCDVGSLDAYRSAQYAALSGEVALHHPYRERSPGVWVGDETFIDPSAIVESPVMIGDRCRIGARTRLEAGTIIGDNVTVGLNADLKHPIVWNGTVVGDEVRLIACVLGRGVRVERLAQVLEGAVIGPLCTIGEEANVRPNIRVWPSKIIDPGATLNQNLIWGAVARRNLFGQRGVTGIANVDVIPEFAVKLGAAYGSTLRPGSQVTVSRDQRSVSWMVSRSLISGLMSVGINVQNLEATAIPIARSVVPILGVVGGLHVRVDPEKSDHILIEFYDRRGINLSKASERKVEGAFFKEDFRRATISDIGTIVDVNQAFDLYSRGFEQNLNVMALKESCSRVVIDYAYAVSGAILPQLLAKFGCDAVVLNASLTQNAPTSDDRDTLLLQLGQVVQVLRATFGVQVSANGEQLIIVDDSGSIIRGETLTALMVDLMLSVHPRSTVVVPVNASSAIEDIARRYDAKVIRTKANPTALMEACDRNANVSIGGSGSMGFIFPNLHPGFDAMFCIAKLIELLAQQKRTLAQIRDDCPHIHHVTISLRCPWQIKGAIMRHFVESHTQDEVELIDGIKIFNRQHDSWVLILPDASTPTIHICGNSRDRNWVDETLREYRRRVKVFVAEAQGIQEFNIPEEG